MSSSDELPLLQQRLQNGEINITAPMVGDSPLSTTSIALEFETNCLKRWSCFEQLFKKERMETSRRSILLRPEELKWQWVRDNNIEISFYLPSGCYATSVLRELIIGN